MIITSRQREILRALDGRGEAAVRQAIARILNAQVNFDDIELVCNEIHREFLMLGINPDYSPNNYGFELEELLDVINHPRIAP